MFQRFVVRSRNKCRRSLLQPLFLLPSSFLLQLLLFSRLDTILIACGRSSGVSIDLFEGDEHPMSDDETQGGDADWWGWEVISAEME